MTFTTIASFTEIASRYDGFILDQFGVMHNGKHSLPGADECVQKLAGMGKKLIILSNTSSPSETALAKLPQMGFDTSCFVGAVTSGEEASRHINEHYQGKKVIWFSWADPAVPEAFLSKCGNIEPTTNVDEADFVISHGCDVIRSVDGDNHLSLGDYMHGGDFSVIDSMLEKCLQKGLPMICANPDLICKLPGDVTANMPGKIAQKYEQMGGKCKYFGKPHAEHFLACLRELGLDSSKVAHVGDSLHHDIAGANDAGISSVFITGGIHSEEFNCNIGDMPDEDSLRTLFEREKHTPTHVAPLFRF